MADKKEIAKHLFERYALKNMPENIAVYACQYNGTVNMLNNIYNEIQQRFNLFNQKQVEIKLDIEIGDWVVITKDFNKNKSSINIYSDDDFKNKFKSYETGRNNSKKLNSKIVKDDPDAKLKRLFEVFKAECLRLQKELGLTDYQIYFECVDLKKAVFTNIDVNYSGRVAMIRLNSDIGEDKGENEKTVKSHAKHEMMHLLLDEIVSLANFRFIGVDDISIATERLVVKLTELISV